MIEYIKYNDIINNSMSESMVMRHRKFLTKINLFSNKYNFNSITIGLKVAMVIQDSQFFMNTYSQSTIQLSNEPYIIGKIFNINVYVDPMLQWDNNEIIINNDLIYLRKLKIKKIKKIDSNIKYIDKIVIDNELLEEIAY